MRKHLIRAGGLVALLLCGACGGGVFLPSSGVFAGSMSTADGLLGQLDFTYTDGLIGGTAILMIAGDMVPVSIAGVVQGQSITGEVRNANLGGGDFVGVFQDTTHASGTFTFVDTAETISLTGTWTVAVPTGN